MVSLWTWCVLLIPVSLVYAYATRTTPHATEAPTPAQV